ncbi:MAG: ribosome recycling factor [Anaerolineae bacterium]|nr:ribosome recycling factor [Anaerolineae bacterium]
MITDLLQETEERMIKSVEALEEDLRSVRTGRASPALVEKVLVDYYGAPTQLKQLATISAPEPQMLLIRPYDQTSIGAIDKAIMAADLGLNPSNDGRVVRIPIPRLTEERRRDLAKVVKKRTEEAKVALRNVRRDSLSDMRSFESEKLISEDDLKRGQEQLQKLTDGYTEQVEEIGARKEKELMEI